MFRRPTPPASRFRPLNPWDQEEERHGIAEPDPIRDARPKIKPLNERLAEARKARSAELAQQTARLPESLGQPARDTTPRAARTALTQPLPPKPARRPGGLVADQGEAEHDYPFITRAVQALTQALGHRPKPGETIPAEAVEPYLKALAGDRFDRRADADFFRHVEGVYRAAFPNTYIDASGRMIDTPARAIPFTPFGPTVPRPPQPRVLKASAPAEGRAEMPRAEMPARDGAGETKIAQAGPATQNPATMPHHSPATTPGHGTASGPATSHGAPSVPPNLADYDIGFVHKRENAKGDIEHMVIPTDRNGNVIEKSGPTIGFGVDVGQRNADDLNRLVV